jgi:hypothetical protein
MMAKAKPDDTESKKEGDGLILLSIIVLLGLGYRVFLLSSMSL